MCVKSGKRSMAAIGRRVAETASRSARRERLNVTSTASSSFPLIQRAGRGILLNFHARYVPPGTSGRHDNCHFPCKSLRQTKEFVVRR